jgi:hypothetical protein
MKIATAAFHSHDLIYLFFLSFTDKFVHVWLVNKMMSVSSMFIEQTQHFVLLYSRTQIKSWEETYHHSQVEMNQSMFESP